MPYIITEDGTEIFYKDWGGGTPVHPQPRLAAERRRWEPRRCSSPSTVTA